MKVIRMKITDVPENSILAQDVFLRSNRLVSKGNKLTNRILTLLCNRGIQFIYVENGNMPAKNPIKPIKTSNNFKYSNFNSVGNDTLSEWELVKLILKQDTKVMDGEHVFREEHIEALSQLSTEVRYGRSIKNSEDNYYIHTLFVKYMKNDLYRSHLNALKEKDHYTYLHAIDVFTLGILFLRSIGYQDCEEIGIGFLFHDVGKLKTPDHILKKRGQLTRREFEIMEQHTVDGYDMLVEMGVEKFAHLALSHHERLAGKGYPQHLNIMELQEEVRILQLIDMYAAITLKRPYKVEKKATDAIKLLFREKDTINEELLVRFVEFLGIFPESTIVLLSDGTHATVEKVNELYPLLPTVRVFQTGASFSLPIDFSLTITKIISYDVDTPEQLFLKFTDYMINLDNQALENYYMQLKDHYRSFEWFTYLYIPFFQIFHVLYSQKIVEESRIKRSGQYLSSLLMKTIIHLRLNTDKKSNVLLVINREKMNPILAQIFEGILHTEGMYSIVLNEYVGSEELQNHLDRGITHLFMLGDVELTILETAEKVEIYNFKEEELQKMLIHFASIRPKKVNLMKEIEKYKYVQKLIR